MLAAANSPETYAIRERGIRRVNLDRFPYHFYFAASAMWFGFLSCVITAGIHR
jgi:hypothetical protein